jgi:Ca-activated chloride channel family protein
MTHLMRPMSQLAALVLALWPGLAPACETALVLAMDVSNSVDEGEYRLQADGLADALADPEVIGAILDGGAALAVMHWSGPDQQAVTQPWALLTTPAEIAAFAEAARATPRTFRLSGTAPAEALSAALALLTTAPPCKRQVIDLSGDGTPNAGGDPRSLRRDAERAGVTINGLAIESLGLAITGFYRSAIITADGFVITARDHRDFPRAIRDKLVRELSRLLG